MLNAANLITLTRIAMIPPFVWAALSFLSGESDSGTRWIALSFFLLAALTDGVDGLVARRMGQVTHFGMFIDPLADKLLITAALLCFVDAGRIGVVPVLLVISREFIVTSLRVVALGQGRVIAAGFSGKLKMILQAVVVAFLFTPLSEPLLFSGLSWGTVAVWLMTIVTVWSGGDYLTRHGRLLLRASTEDQSSLGSK